MIKISYFISLIILLVFHCVPEAPHDNALDPYHGIASETGIDLVGEVIQKIEPHPPIKHCLVLLLHEGRFDTTGSDGRFRFSNLLSSIHQVVINKIGSPF